MSRVCYLLLLVIPTVWASPPLWETLEQGQELFDQRHYPEALVYFLDAREQQPLYPEAEYWIGRVYQNDRNLELAIKQYRKAIGLKDHLYQQDEIYPIYYHLADIYRRSGKVHFYEQALLELTMEEHYPDEQSLRREANFVERLKNGGLDAMLYSQSLTLQYSEDALRQLGLLYYSQKFYSSAVNMLAYPVLSFFNKALAWVQQQHPDFAFPLHPESDLLRSSPFLLFSRLTQDMQTLQLEEPMSYDGEGLQAGLDAIRAIDRNYQLSAFGFFLDYLKRDEQGRDFIEKKHIYQTLYYLAASLWSSGYDQNAKQIWQVLRYHGEAPHWQSKATAQLFQPFVDPDPLP